MGESHSWIKEFFTSLWENLLPLIILIALLVLSVTSAPMVLEFKENYLEEAQRLIASLFVVAVFVERALEVFVVTWRGPRTNELDAEIVHYSEQLAIESKRSGGMVTSQMMEIENKLKTLQQERIHYKSDTQRMALWGGLLLGVLIGAGGLRVLSSLLANYTALGNMQRIIFVVTDVLLTGGLLAGGSEGIHKIYKVYSEFMDATAKRAKASNPTSDITFRTEARTALETQGEAQKSGPVETPFGGSVG